MSQAMPGRSRQGLTPSREGHWALARAPAPGARGEACHLPPRKEWGWGRGRPAHVALFFKVEEAFFLSIRDLSRELEAKECSVHRDS